MRLAAVVLLSGCAVGRAIYAPAGLPANAEQLKIKTADGCRRR